MVNHYDAEKLVGIIEQLERSNRNWRRLGGVLLFVAVVFAIGWAPVTGINKVAPAELAEPEVDPSLKPEKPLPVVSERTFFPGTAVLRDLKIVDEQGRPRMELSATSAEGAKIRLLDETGKSQAVIFVNEKGPGVSLFDTAGNTRIGLSVVSDSPDVRVLDEAGETWALIREHEGRRMLLLSGQEGKSRVAMMVHNADSTLSMAGGSGKQQILGRVDQDGPRVTLIGAEGQPLSSQP